MPFKKKNEWVVESYVTTVNGLALRTWKVKSHPTDPEKQWFWTISIDDIYHVTSGFASDADHAKKQLTTLAKGKYKNAKKMNDKALEDGLIVVVPNKEKK